MNIIEAKNIVKAYTLGEITNTVLKGVDITVKKGEFISIMGKSGAGKSTLMYQLGLLDRPTEGSLMLDGEDVFSLSSRKRTALRLEKLGYVFQNYSLLPELSARENVMLPLLMLGWTKTNAQFQADKMLEQVGLGEREQNLPSQLSGGEQQRVSIARAIVNTPKILFADEPTANLDTDTSEGVMKVFQDLHKGGQTIVMVTHELEYGQLAERIVHLESGQIERDQKPRKKRKKS